MSRTKYRNMGLGSLESERTLLKAELKYVEELIKLKKKETLKAG